jgi:predicted house-cleaning noncanonical NTP pyrophosphatase (MazG superfamily)
MSEKHYNKLIRDKIPEVIKEANKISSIEVADNALYKIKLKENMKLNDYINWFNYHRLHGSLDYLSPVDYRLQYSI